MKTHRISRVFFAFCLLLAVYASALSLKDLSDVPPLKNGDIIFQTNLDPQAHAVTAATLSLYTHTGIVKKMESGYAVIEAADIVRDTPLEKWVKRGAFKRFAVYRHKYLTDAQAAQVVENAEKYAGRPYDIYFYFDESQIYCSELPYLAYEAAGMPVGTVQQVSELYLDNRFVKSLIKRRWEAYPVCTGRNYSFEQCYDIIMSEKIITPISIAQDPNLELIYTNYRL
jgi:hypothetical protein